MARLRVVLEVRGVQGEQYRRENSSLWRPCAAYHSLRFEVPQSNKLGPFSEVICDPGHQAWVNSHLQQFDSQKEGLDGVKSAGEVKKHDSHSTASYVQVRVLHSEFDGGDGGGEAE